MKCAICGRGETAPGFATATFTKGETTVVVKRVPAQVCGTGGEEYFDEKVTRRLLALADEAVRSGVEVDVRQFVAA